MAFRGGGSGLKDEDYFGGYLHKNRRRHNLSGTAVKIMFSLVLIGVICFAVYQSDRYSIQLVHKSPRPRQNLGISFHGFKFEHLTSKKKENSLDNTLRRAAMEDQKIVILTTLNAAWAEPGSVFDLFLESLRIGIETESLVKHLVVAALDGKAYARCSEVHPHCFALTTAGVDFSGEAHVSSYDYNKMLWRRVEFLRSVLEMGYDFLFTDADILWLRNPFQRFYPDADLQITSDIFKRNSSDPNARPNAGCLYARSNNRTIRFYDLWYNRKDDNDPQTPDRALLDIVRFDPIPDQVGLRIRFLDSAYFGGLCSPVGDLSSAVVMRADCCGGLEDKVHDMKVVIGDWMRYVAEGDWRKGGTWRRKDSWRCGLKK